MRVVSVADQLTAIVTLPLIVAAVAVTFVALLVTFHRYVGLKIEPAIVAKEPVRVPVADTMSKVVPTEGV